MITALQADITTLAVDVIVNAANSSLLGASVYSVDLEQCSRPAISSRVRCANPSARKRATTASNSSARRAVA